MAIREGELECLFGFRHWLVSQDESSHRRDALSPWPSKESVAMKRKGEITGEFTHTDRGRETIQGTLVSKPKSLFDFK